MAGTMQSSGRGTRGAIVGINVTPMVDVVLVLLVIMMVSATYIVSQSLKVELPKTATSDDSSNSIATVTITDKGEFLFNGDAVSEEELVRRLRETKAKGGDPSLVVSADQAALHGKVVHVIDLAKVEGISKFAIHVERSR